MRLVPFVASFAGALALAGCAGTGEHRTGSPVAASAQASGSGSSSVAAATANLAAASGSLVSGQLKLVPMGDGVHVTGDIHEKGDCSAADASSAGGHFNPTGQPHGRASAPKHHAGDSDNLVADAQGVAKVNAHFAGIVLGSGGNDAIGKAVVVHADPDDYRSQPAGNAGSRIAGGVIKAG